MCVAEVCVRVCGRERLLRDFFNEAEKKKGKKECSASDPTFITRSPVSSDNTL
jgi:hypothetical protein